MEKTMIIMIPSQKAGTDMPRYVSPLMILSASLFLWVPAIRPNGMARTRKRPREAPIEPGGAGQLFQDLVQYGPFIINGDPQVSPGGLSGPAHVLLHHISVEAQGLSHPVQLFIRHLMTGGARRHTDKRGSPGAK